MFQQLKEKLLSWWRIVWAYANGLSFLKTAIAFFFFGIVVWGGFNLSMDMTNTESFCVSCHEMKDYVFEEYKETHHYSNRTGVRATCPDCHVPKVWIYKVMRKVQATNELYHKAMGTINTPEKFEANRMEMAERVWRVMKKTDSRECRNCHKFDYMNFEKQDRRSARKHKKAVDKGQTCIDCHKGVAHKLPEGYEED